MVKEAECKRCGKRSKLLCENLGFCLDCIRGLPDEVLLYSAFIPTFI